MAKPTTLARASKPGASQTALEPMPNHHWQPVFLATLAETSNVSAAAAAVGIFTSRAYRQRRESPTFARAWHEALCEGYDLLELELLQRLRFGESKDAEAKFDNANALRLLSQHRETAARSRAIRENADVSEVRASILKKLLEMRDQSVARRKADQEADEADTPHE